MNEETQSCDSYKAEYKRNETSVDTGCSQWAKQGRISPYLDLRGGSACKALYPSCRFAAESCRIV